MMIALVVFSPLPNWPTFVFCFYFGSRLKRAGEPLNDHVGDFDMMLTNVELDIKTHFHNVSSNVDKIVLVIAWWKQWVNNLKFNKIRILLI